MPHYAIGDVQGCYSSLRRLLEKLNFEPARDHLWFAGDLVNRGPESLETVRFVKSLGAGAAMVLGNHDLHLICVALLPGRRRAKDTFHDILDAPDCHEIIDWLRHRPMLIRDGKSVMVHAGLPPNWNINEAEAHAKEVEAMLASDRCLEFLAHIYGDEPSLWHPSLAGWDRLRFITNALTRMRYCDSEGRIDLRHKGPPGTQPAGLIPWFSAPDRKSRGVEIIFGHWSTLGVIDEPGLHPLDTGCLWGGELTALRLDDLAKISIPCPVSHALAGDGD